MHLFTRFRQQFCPHFNAFEARIAHGKTPLPQAVHTLQQGFKGRRAGVSFSLKERRPDRQDSEQQFNWSQTGEVLKVKWHHNFHRGRAQTNGARLCLKDQPQPPRWQRHEERNPVVSRFGGSGAAASPCAEAATHPAKPKHDQGPAAPAQFSALRLVLRTQPRSGIFAQPATTQIQPGAKSLSRSNAADVPALSQPRSFSWARDLHAFGVKSLHLRKIRGEGRFGQETNPSPFPVLTCSRLCALRVSAVSLFTAEARRSQRGFAVGAFATNRKRGWIRSISVTCVATKSKVRARRRSAP